MRKPVRIWLAAAAVLAALLMACGAAALLVVRSAWFREQVRQRIVADIEKATGGRVELGSFNFDWTHLVATAAPLVLHGKEAAGEPPLLRVPSVALGLRIVSIFERKIDLASLRVERPEVHINLYADGSTNVLLRTRTSWAGDLLDFAVRRYEIVDGLVEFDARKIPLNLRGENLQLRMTYEPVEPRYRGTLSSRRVRVASPGVRPVDLDASLDFAFSRFSMEIPRMRLGTGGARFDLAGAIQDIRTPRGAFTLKANVPVRDAVSLFHLPIAPVGAATFDGRMSISLEREFDYSVSGLVQARGLGYTRGRLKIEGADARASLNLTPEKLTLRALTANALGSTWSGEADLDKWKDLHFQGKFEGLSVREAASIAIANPVPWNGTLAGDVTVDAVLGQASAKVQAGIGIAPAAEGTPIQGQIEVSYDQQAGSLRLGNSYVATPATRLDVMGTLGQTLEIRARSTNLDDLLPAIALAVSDAPKRLPLKFVNGSATFDGAVTGSLEDPRVTGRVAVNSARWDGHAFDRFTSDVEAGLHSVTLQRLMLSRGATAIEGSAGIAAGFGNFKDGKFEDGALAAQLSVRNASLAELAKEAGVTTAVAGTATATLRVSGTMRRPEAEIGLQVDQPSAFGEQADRLRANLRYAPAAVEVVSGEADAGPGKLLFQGAYRHSENDWGSGDLRFDLTAQGMPVSRAQMLAKLEPGLDAILDGKVNGTARLVKGAVVLNGIDGEVAAHDVTWDRQALGNVSLTAHTSGADLAVRANAQFPDATAQVEGSWRLEGDGPGSARVRFSRLSVATLHKLATIAGTPEQRNAVPPFDGFIEGGATLSVALRRPQDFRAQLTLDTVELNAKPGQALQLGVKAQDLVVRNAKPVVVTLSSKEARIASAQFTARNTSLEVTGGIPFNAGTGADLAVRGSVDLAILQLLKPDLLARGNATVQASIRGSVANPQLNGRMELKNASLYLNGVPQGVDSVNGAVLFDRNRATIEKLTAETGGGTITFGGFVEFSSTLAYRLQAQGQNVRFRYEGVGVTLDAKLALNGTSGASTVTGTLTATRATVSPNADVGQLLASAARPTPAPDPNQYLRGMQFDVRIESAPNFEFQTSLTRDVETAVDLRLRGTPLQPALLGTVSVNQGEVEAFGNRYTIDRGDIRFLNSARIEPSFDLDLETKARGITVNIAISGTLQRLNVNYSSDPPLQSREIVALLAVGRTPAENAGLATTQDTSGTSDFAQAGGGILNQALSSQTSSRMQRFFGSSHVKLDPDVTGVDYLPEARLTLEQQVSRDITLTYVTNLNRTQEQIVQVEWDFNQHWSAVAVREASGLFGIDLQYKKRFK